MTIVSNFEKLELTVLMQSRVTSSLVERRPDDRLEPKAENNASPSNASTQVDNISAQILTYSLKKG